MALYLITGGAGFIGSHLAEELLRRGEQVRVLDNFSTGKRENLREILGQIELIEGDLRSYHTVHQAVQGVDYVLHHGALPSVPRSIDDPITTNEVNVGGTLHVLDAARDAGVKRVIYASSSSIYGPDPQLPAREDMATRPVSPYAVAKLAGEKYCHVFSKVYGLETIALRYFNIFGPRQDPTSQYSAFIPKFAVGIMEGRPLTVDGDGNQAKDFTFVSNVVAANLLAVAAPGVSGEVFNVGCGQMTSVNEIVEHLQRVTGTAGKITHGPSRAGDVPRSLADISQAREKLGYTPQVSAREGLEKVVAWFRDKFKEGRPS